VAVHLPSACEHPDAILFQEKCYLVCDPTDPTDSQGIGMRDGRLGEKIWVMPSE
jgi:hypothetical protein